jgi:hypothetical protein
MRTTQSSALERVHLFVRPDKREPFAALFRDVLGCEVIERDFGMRWPIVLIRFGDGSAFSVEFSELAAEEPAGEALDDARALRGAWIEFRTRNRDKVDEKLRRAGVPHFRHPGSTHNYYSAPGGQVFRILDVAYQGP